MGSSERKEDLRLFIRHSPGRTQCRQKMETPISTDWSNKFHLDLTYIRLPLKSTETKDKEKTKETPR